VVDRRYSVGTGRRTRLSRGTTPGPWGACQIVGIPHTTIHAPLLMATVSDAFLDFFFGFNQNWKPNSSGSRACFNQYPDIWCDIDSPQKAFKDGKPLVVDAICGSHITKEIIPSIVGLSGQLNHSVIAELNAVNLLVLPCDTVEQAIENYRTAETELQKEHERRRQEYEASPEYAEAQAKAKAEAARIDAIRVGILERATESLTLKDSATWDHFVSVNSSDPYGKGVIDFASLWARMMESEINSGKLLVATAKECSHLADTDGITGFMYGAAVNVLSQCWIYGDDLRAWHNKDYGKQGAEATEAGAVINPAVMIISA